MYTIQMVRGMGTSFQKGVKWDMSAMESGAPMSTTNISMNPVASQKVAAIIRQRIMDAYFSGQISLSQRHQQMHEVYKQYR